jgi:hypothetical protein
MVGCVNMMDSSPLIVVRANAFMNAWNSDFVRASYEKQTLGFLTHFDSKTQLHPTRVALAFRRLVSEDDYNSQDKKTLDKARSESLKTQPKIPYETLNWLGFTMMLSELGKHKELADLLEYADTHLNPTWEKGGLYYPRNQTLYDENWNLTHMEPHSGNSGIGYARLNVPDGQKKMWERPWTHELLESRPWLDGAGFEDDIDFLRGVWDADRRAMIVTVRRWQGANQIATFVLKNAEAGSWAVYVNGSLKEVRDIHEGTDLEIEVSVGQEEVDIVIQQIA